MSSGLPHWKPTTKPVPAKIHNHVITNNSKNKMEIDLEKITDNPADAENQRLRQLNTFLVNFVPDSASSLTLLMESTLEDDGIHFHTSTRLDISILPDKEKETELEGLAVGLAKNMQQDPNIAKVILRAVGLFNQKRN